MHSVCRWRLDILNYTCTIRIVPSHQVVKTVMMHLRTRPTITKCKILRCRNSCRAGAIETTSVCACWGSPAHGFEKNEMIRGLQVPQQAGITQRQSPVHDVQGTRYPVGFGGVARRRVVSSPSAPMVRGLQAGITQRQSPVCRALAMGHVCRLPHNNQTIKGSPLPTPRPNTMGPLRTRGAERCSVAINVGEADHIEVPMRPSGAP